MDAKSLSEAGTIITLLDYLTQQLELETHTAQLLLYYMTA